MFQSPVGMYLRNRLIQRAIVVGVLLVAALEVAAEEVASEADPARPPVSTLEVSQGHAVPGCMTTAWLGIVMTTNRNTRNFDQVLLDLQKDVHQRGGNGIINLRINDSGRGMRVYGTAVKVKCLPPFASR